MNTIDKIARDAKILVNSARDTANSNLATSLHEKKISLTENQLKEVMRILDVSFEEGYQKAVVVFQNTIKKHIA